jgi:hypothetical protein
MSEEKVEGTVEEAIAQNELSPLIYGRMAAVMQDVDAIVKKEQSTQVKYAFRSIEDVMNAIHPILAKHQVLIVPTGHELTNQVFEKGQGKFSYQAVLKSSYRFYTIDGSFVDASMCAESIDYSDKATQQASSYIYKNLILQTFCIPTKDLMSDGDGKQPDRENEKPATAKAATPATRSQVLQDTRLSDRPNVVEQARAAAGGDYITADQWAAIKGLLAPFALTDNAWYTWTIAVLRANNLVVPPNLAHLSVDVGRTLYRVAKASVDAGQLVHVQNPPPAAPAAPAAPSGVPTHTGPEPEAAPAAPSAPAAPAAPSAPTAEDEFV